MEAVISKVCRKLGLPAHPVKFIASEMKAGTTVPFLCRYRKQHLQSMDEESVRRVIKELQEQASLVVRVKNILAAMVKSEKLTPALEAQLKQCQSVADAEEIYEMYKEKTSTNAQKASAAGLDGAAELVLNAVDATDMDLRKEINSAKPPSKSATEADADAKATEAGEGVEGKKHAEKELTSDEKEKYLEALVSERIVSVDKFRQAVNDVYSRECSIETKLVGKPVNKAAKAKSAEEFEKMKQNMAYYDNVVKYASQLQAHQFLAIQRGSKLGVLKSKWTVDPYKLDNQVFPILAEVFPAVVLSNKHNRKYLTEIRQRSIAAAKSRLMKLAITHLTRLMRNKAEATSVKVFQDNLKSMLMKQPIVLEPRRSLLAMDPGFINGTKFAVLTGSGDVVSTGKVFTCGTPPLGIQQSTQRKQLAELIVRERVQFVVIGDGQGSKEAETFISQILKSDDSVSDDVQYAIVTEVGASVYSASSIAREELRTYDILVRGAITIGRRVLNPLAEFVKVEPESLGVGMYQHDITPKKLSTGLTEQVEDCVNEVGVDINSATPAILKYVSGISPRLAQSIVNHRMKHGNFQCRESLLQVPGMTPKIFEKCAGFVVVPSSVEPLDETRVHVESYPAARKLLKAMGLNYSTSTQLTATAVTEKFGSVEAAGLAVGVDAETCADIIKFLQTKSYDPRKDLGSFTVFKRQQVSLNDIAIGTLLPGTVQNVTSFGAFVDVGLDSSGLIPKQLAHRRGDIKAYDALRSGFTVNVYFAGFASASHKKYKKFMLLLSPPVEGEKFETSPPGSPQHRPHTTSTNTNPRRTRAHFVGGGNNQNRSYEEERMTKRRH